MKLCKKNRNTIIYRVIVFFLIITINIFMIRNYSNKMYPKMEKYISNKIEKVVYQFFSDLITDEVINKEEVKDILVITKNNKGEILTVNYDMEKTYKILTSISQILKTNLQKLENGLIEINVEDDMIEENKDGLVVYVPAFMGNNTIILNNLGPKIPFIIRFNDSLLTNIKTKVTNYGLNNALLEIYVTVEINELIVTPISSSKEPFNYNILISALVINGAVPNIYGGNYESLSSIFSVPLK